MAKRSTRRDVADLAGVSVATVSYVVNDGPRPVSEETRERVLVAIEQLRYRPHAIARSLKTGNTRTIGLLVQSLIEPYIGHLVNAVEDYLVDHDYGLILATSHENCERENRMIDVLASQHIDGLLFIPASCNNKESVTQLMEQGIPVVFMDRYIPGVSADVVMSDNINASRTSTNFMINKGCRRIVCISFSQDASSAIDRVEGYRMALQENGIPVDEELILNVNHAIGEVVGPYLDEFFYNNGLPDGILCTAERFVVDTRKHLKQNQISVPGQVLVVGGFFNSPWNALLDPPVPIVNQDFQRIAHTASEFLIERLQGIESPPRTVLIEVEFLSHIDKEVTYDQ